MAKLSGGGLNPQTMQGAVGGAMAKALSQNLLRAVSGRAGAQLTNALGNLFRSLGRSAGAARFRAAMANLNQASAKAAAGAAPLSAAFRAVGPAARAAAGAVPVLGPGLLLAAGAVGKLTDMAGGLVSAAAEKGGGAGLSQAFETLAETLGTVLLPIMTAVGGAVIAVADVMWGALQPVLGALFQTIVSAVVPAGAVLLGVLFKVAKFLLDPVAVAFARVVNFAYKLGKSLVDFLSPVFDFIVQGWRTVAGFLINVFDAMLGAGTVLGHGLGAVVEAIGEAVEFITGGMFGGDIKKAGADLKAFMIGAMVRPALPPGGGGPAAPVIDPDIFRKMADAIPDVGAGGGLDGMMKAMVGGMRAALTETEFARFGQQGGFKGIVEAWKSAQTASFRSPEEAKRDRMAMEAIGTLKKILGTLEEGLGGPGPVGP